MMLVVEVPMLLKLLTGVGEGASTKYASLV